MNVESVRRIYLAIAEAMDAWRVFPRFMVCMYMVMVYQVVQWYMKLEPELVAGCVAQRSVECLIQAPTNQHAALVTAVIGFSAAIFGFYANSGRPKDVPPKEKDDTTFANKPDEDNGY